MALATLMITEGMIVTSICDIHVCMYVCMYTCLYTEGMFVFDFGKL